MWSHQQPRHSSIVTFAAAVCAAAALVFGVHGSCVPCRVVAAESQEVYVAHAFTAAWNARDLDGLAALLGEAQVRQRNARVVQYGYNVAVSDVYGSSSSYEGAPPRTEGNEVLWASGPIEIRAWLASVLPAAQPVITTNYRVNGTTVTWEYKVPVPLDIQRAVPGMPALSGMAEAQVSSGQITRLILTSTPGVAARSEEALAAAIAAVHAGTRADQATGDAAGDGHSLNTPSTQGRTSPSPAHWLTALALMLGGSAGAALLHSRHGDASSRSA
jgi:hypothetical protein